MRYLFAIALAAVAATACGCQAETSDQSLDCNARTDEAETSDQSLDCNARTDETEYYEPGPDFRLAREASRLKAERRSAQDGESAPKDVHLPEPHEPTSE